jgi:hypothetical protein
MHRTSQAFDRYVALERELIDSLETEQLEELQRQCVQAASDLRSEEIEKHYRWGLICLGACLASALVGIGVFLLSLLWTRTFAIALKTGGLSGYFLLSSCTLVIGVWLVYKLWTKPEADYGYGLAFFLPDRSVFAVYEWVARPDNPSELRRWQEARDGQHGGIDVLAQRLQESDQKNLKRAEGLGRNVFMGIVGLYVGGIALSCLGGAPIILLFGGLGLMFRHAYQKYLHYRGDTVPRYDLDPDKSCFGHSYQRIIQVLDQRGSPQASRRFR